jgi:lipopolysaccharide/colanic/teichoic acid biosynthesis glycosyltransferase
MASGILSWKGKRLFDFIFSLLLLVMLSPLLLILALSVSLDSPGSPIFRQTRIGLLGRPFMVNKFRTMLQSTHEFSAETLGKSDPRITRLGRILRKTKLDELPQLFNVLLGEMSFVGPRPEIPKYVDLSDPSLKSIIRLRPGLTDYASLRYFNLDSIVDERADLNIQSFYSDNILVNKRELQEEYVRQISITTDLKIISLTVLRIFGVVKK